MSVRILIGGAVLWLIFCWAWSQWEESKMPNGGGEFTGWL